jgi:hypothetical protein
MNSTCLLSIFTDIVPNLIKCTVCLLECGHVDLSRTKRYLRVVLVGAALMEHHNITVFNVDISNHHIPIDFLIYSCIQTNRTYHWWPSLAGPPLNLILQLVHMLSLSIRTLITHHVNIWPPPSQWRNIALSGVVQWAANKLWADLQHG